MKQLNKFLALGTAAAIAVSASSFAVAAPIGSGQLAVKNAATSDVIDVSSRGRRNTAIALGVLGGLALGGALSHSYPYSHGYPYYGPTYYAAPPPPPPPTRCWVQTGPYRGQGYWAYC